MNEKQRAASLAALIKAIKSAGSAAKLGALIDCNAIQVGMWRYRKNVPPQYVIPIEKVTGVSRHLLRPDIFPKE